MWNLGPKNQEFCIFFDAPEQFWTIFDWELRLISSPLINVIITCLDEWKLSGFKRRMKVLRIVIMSAQWVEITLKSLGFQKRLVVETMV